ncbi:MAG: 8-amino-7-oxononanoate synthase [Rikenellaceae bacterium]
MKELLEKLIASDNLRTLNETETLQKYIINNNKQYINLSSNDYLGLASSDLQRQFIESLDFNAHFLMSNPSSRLMTGNSSYYTQLEQKIADLYGKECALVLSNGFMLNSGALPALTTADDLIIADKLVHASMIDGMRLCECRFTRFRHNDTAHLRYILEHADCKGTIFVVLESIYSMDGDTAPLREIIALRQEFDFKIYLDEAHAFGVYNLGIAQREGLLDEIDFLVVTLGKAAASSGAFIVLDALSKEVLVNRMRTLIFSTALPPITLLWSKFVIDRMAEFDLQRAHLHRLSQMLATGVEEITGRATPVSHIIPVLVGDNGKCVELSNSLKNSGFWVTAIRYPTVAKDAARLRISLTASLTEDDIQQFIGELRKNYLSLQSE